MNRKILFGYRIQDGKLTIQQQEAEVVRRIFDLYLGGKLQRKISDVMNAEHIPYNPDRPTWTSFRVAFILKNQRYMGGDGYPVLIDENTFQAVQSLLQKKSGKHSQQYRPVSDLQKRLRCPCGGCLKRWYRHTHSPDVLYLECDECGTKVTIPDADLLAEVERQAAVYTPLQAEGGYTPSTDTVRLTNAINRGLEKPEHPEEVVALIMQGVSARYACFPTQMTSADLLRLIREKNYNQAIQYITITADNAVKVTFR